jgi:hypothetical protein
MMRNKSRLLRSGFVVLSGLEVRYYGLTWNATLLESVPLGVVTSIVPVVAPLGTAALMYVLDTTENAARSL